MLPNPNARIFGDNYGHAILQRETSYVRGLPDWRCITHDRIGQYEGQRRRWLFGLEK